MPQRKMANFFRVVLLAALPALAGCGSWSPAQSGLPKLGVGTRFAIENLCDIGLSPPIQLSNVPAATTAYVVQITNVNVVIQTPWREVIPLTSKTEIPEGAAKTYDGPCLGDMTRFEPISRLGYRYRVEVLAEDAGGKPLAYGETFVYVESAYMMAKRQRLQGTPGGAPPAVGPGSGPPPLGGYESQTPAMPGLPAGSSSNFGMYR